MNIEQEIIKLLKNANKTKVTLWALIEVSSFTDKDGEEIISTANTACISDDESCVYLADEEYSGEVWVVNELPENIQQNALETIQDTLKFNV